MKKRTINIHEVEIRFEVPEYEINIDDGRGDIPELYKEGQVDFLEAFALMCRRQLVDLGTFEKMVITIDGQVEYDQVKDESIDS